MEKVKAYSKAELEALLDDYCKYECGYNEWCKYIECMYNYHECMARDFLSGLDKERRYD